MAETHGTMQPGQNAGSRPDPDPTERTIDSLRREIGALRELIEARLDGSDKAVKLLQEATNRIPAHVQTAVGTLRQLHDEKFASIQTQFRERDTRAEQTAKDNKTSIDAALQAAKEAVSEQNKSNTLAIDKSEAAFTKQIDAIGQLIATTASSIDGKINDIKERLTTIEGRKAGMGEVWGVLLGIGSLIVTAIIVASFIMART